MTGISRRQFSGQMMGSLLTYTLLETVITSNALAGDASTVTAKWLKDLNEHGRALKGKSLTEEQWKSHVEKLMSKVELSELLAFLDFKKLTANLKFRDQGELSLRPRFPKVEGLPTELVFGHQVFALTEGRSVVPHGHDNMATAFLILDGEFHGRHYDRLEDTRRSMIIRPTIDRQFTTGEYSTITELHDNVHWFKASSKTGFIFNIHVLNLEQGRATGRVYVDPDGKKLSGGRIEAPRIKAAEAFKKYG